MITWSCTHGHVHIVMFNWSWLFQHISGPVHPVMFIWSYSVFTWSCSLGDVDLSCSRGHVHMVLFLRSYSHGHFASYHSIAASLLSSTIQRSAWILVALLLSCLNRDQSIPLIFSILLLLFFLFLLLFFFLFFSLLFFFHFLFFRLPPAKTAYPNCPCHLRKWTPQSIKPMVLLTHGSWQSSKGNPERFEHTYLVVECGLNKFGTYLQ